MIRFACWSCTRSLTVAVEMVGLWTECPGCGKRCQVPDGRVQAGQPASQPQQMEASGSGIVFVHSRRTSWLKRLIVLAPLLVVACLLGGGYLAWKRWGPVNSAEERSYARTKAEELVRQSILDRSANPEKVEFVCWGPHMSSREMVALFAEGGIKTPVKIAPNDVVIRVVWKDEEKHDHLVEVNGTIFTTAPFEVNIYGDNWKRAARNKLAKDFPAIKRDEEWEKAPDNPDRNKQQLERSQ